MINHVLLYAGSIIITIWGIAHLAPTRSIVRGFGELSRDNKLTITMEWIAEGITMCFIGCLVFFVTLFGGISNYVTVLVIRISAAMLIIMAILSLFTGARTSVVPMKICPVVKTVTAILFLLGSYL